MKFKAILEPIENAGFIYLGSFYPGAQQTLILIGNAGPDMWARFSSQCDTATTTLDQWTRRTVSHLAGILGADVLFPFDIPPPPFLTWAGMTGATFTSPLGLSIHPVYGLWHGYRAALIFERPLELPATTPAQSPCDSCEQKPCLTTCPVTAFSAEGYNVPACIEHINSTDTSDCLDLGCRARRACPIGKEYHYSPQQARFHMTAFIKGQEQPTDESN